MTGHDTTTTDEQVLDAIEDIIRGHVGADNPITSGEISERLGGYDHLDSTPRTREAIRALVHEREMPIAANGSGYFLISSAEELTDYLDSLQSREDKIADRRAAVRNAFAGSTVIRVTFDGDN